MVDNDLPRHLDKIESKLRNGHPLSKENDIQPLKDIVPSFHRLWKLSKQYPILNYHVDTNLFKSIFSDMSVDFFNNNSEPFHLICDYCQAHVPLIDNNVELAFQNHSRTQRHIEAVKKLYGPKTSEILDTTESYPSDISVQFENLKLHSGPHLSSSRTSTGNDMERSESALQFTGSKSEIGSKTDDAISASKISLLQTRSNRATTNLILPINTQNCNKGTKACGAVKTLDESNSECPSKLSSTPTLLPCNTQKDNDKASHSPRSNLSSSDVPSIVTDSSNEATTTDCTPAYKKFSVQGRLLQYRLPEAALLKRK